MAKSIMVAGTMSNVGKSVITAALCRIFKKDGYTVAPFKSQNMALNSFITEDGLEMGRAQVTQAEAAKIKPDARMNPILLKPVKDTGSQVILHGEVISTIPAREYYAMKKSLIPEVKKSYDSLAKEYDIIVIEGAGSAAELNLKQDDFVNMGMAKLANAPVLLVGNIDLGGIFAQLFGTIKLLDEDEQKLIKATVVNKFRGDSALFNDGVMILNDICGKPCAGVVPWLNVNIDDEDSLSSKFRREAQNGKIDIVVIMLPHISNFTDFNALEIVDGVSVRYVRKADKLGEPDLLIIPGTKNTAGDLLRLRQNGLESAIKTLKNTLIFGICGGYQMLGERIIDEKGVEQQGEIDGMGLLPIVTNFNVQKRRERVSGEILPWSNAKVDGYEIHMGTSKIIGKAKPLLKLDSGALDGCYKGNVYGTYMHGFFDSAACRKAIISLIRERKNITLDSEILDYYQYKENQYDKLANGVRNALDIGLIYKILETGV
jgi:adenosylcobyric acid synthase